MTLNGVITLIFLFYVVSPNSVASCSHCVKVAEDVAVKRSRSLSPDELLVVTAVVGYDRLKLYLEIYTLKMKSWVHPWWVGARTSHHTTSVECCGSSGHRHEEVLARLVAASSH